MSNIEIFDPINLVHSYMLKNYSFEKIKLYTGLRQEELIRSINAINANNNQTIPLTFDNNGNPKIAYQKRHIEIHNFDWFGKELKLAYMADKHIDHKSDRIGYIKKSYQFIEEVWGADYILDLGDILNGPQELVHNPRSCRTGTLEGSMEQLIKYHPKKIPTYFITGNHDLKFMEHSRCDIGRLIEQECPNMRFLNNLFTCLDFGGFKVNLTHGSIEDRYLSDITLGKEHPLLTYNDPHVIVQAHFHISKFLHFQDEDRYGRKRENKFNDTILCQVPALKSGNPKANLISENPNSNRNYKQRRISNINRNMGSDTGVVLLTIKRYNNELDVSHEFLNFSETSNIIQTEKSYKKTISYI